MTDFPKSTTCEGEVGGVTPPGNPGALKDGAPGAVGAAGMGISVASLVA
jgi:hypothetical protein